MAQELSTAKVQLATLINAPVGQDLRVVEPSSPSIATVLAAQSTDTLEQLALAQNPEIREQHYNVRIAQLEARKGLMRVFPNLNFSYVHSYDSDRYLINSDWNQAGASLSYNFMSLLSLGAIKRYGASGVALAEERRLAAHMALLAQVHLARLQMLGTGLELKRAVEISNVDARLADLATDREQAQTQSKLDRVNPSTAAILSELRRYQAIAQSQAAEARLMAVLGVEPEIPSVTDISVSELSALLADAQQWKLPGDLPRGESQATSAAAP